LDRSGGSLPSIDIRSPLGRYVLPLGLLAETAGPDARVTIEIGQASAEAGERAASLAADAGARLLTSGTAFVVRVHASHGAVYALEEFGSAYVERAIPVAAGAVGPRATGVWLDEKQGALRFVPMR